MLGATDGTCELVLVQSAFPQEKLMTAVDASVPANARQFLLLESAIEATMQVLAMSLCGRVSFYGIGKLLEMMGATSDAAVGWDCACFHWS